MKIDSYDVETTGLRLNAGHRMFAWATCNQHRRMDVRRLDGSNLRRLSNKRRLREYWKDSSTVKTAHNAKFDINASENELGVDLSEHIVHCTHRMSHILQNNHHNQSLDYLSWELAGYDKVDHIVRNMAKQVGGYHKVPEHLMDYYQRLDVDRGMALFLFFWPLIKANPKFRDCYQVELDVIRPTIRMERTGMMLHAKRTRKMITGLEREVEETLAALYDFVGHRFNFDSDRQLGKVLYGRLGYPILARTPKSKEPSVDKHVLMSLKEKTGDGIFDMILKARSYGKGVKTLEGYLDLMGADHIIHPTINPCGAITGRQSSEDPNLQNVQKSGVLLNPYPVLARHAFRPRPGYVNLHVDYSGIEMRLLVHYSKEPEMIKCLLYGDGDVHALAAETFYEDEFTQAVGDIRKSLRGAAKNCNFAIPYGATAAKAAGTLGVDKRRGYAAFARYRRRWPRLANLNKIIAAWVREDGYVESAFGRRYHVPRDKAYVGTNWLIQGTGAEILKRAEIRLDKYNREATGDEVKLLLPVHDEVIIQYPRKRMPDLPGYLKDIRGLMIDFDQFSVPLEVEAELVTSSWEHKAPLEIPR